MHSRPLKVGELARRTGLSVRTLHHYDEIGLLIPSQHSEGGHRLYTPEDVARLQQILSLRQLGFTLEQIQQCLRGTDFAPVQVIQLHLTRLREQMAWMQTLCTRLEVLATHLCSTEEVSVEEFLTTIEVMQMFEKYYTPEQLEELRARREEVGEEAIRQVEEEWPQLIAQVRHEMQQGTDPGSERVQQLARRWQELVQAFTGGNPQIEQSLSNMYNNEPDVASQHGLDQALFEYLGKAMNSGQGE